MNIKALEGQRESAVAPAACQRAERGTENPKNPAACGIFALGALPCGPARMACSFYLH